jgi:hypothetical protein
MPNSQLGEKKWINNITDKRLEEVSLTKTWRTVGFWLLRRTQLQHATHQLKPPRLQRKKLSNSHRVNPKSKQLQFKHLPLVNQSLVGPIGLVHSNTTGDRCEENGSVHLTAIAKNGQSLLKISHAHRIPPTDNRPLKSTILNPDIVQKSRPLP